MAKNKSQVHMQPPLNRLVNNSGNYKSEQKEAYK